MPDVLRTCRRTGCRWPAVASLTFRYATREVWLAGLPDEAHPAAYDLCPHHAGTMTVPRGWELIDRRDPAAPPREPAGRDLPAVEPESDEAGRESDEAGRGERGRAGDEAGNGARGRAAAAVPNRYAALSADLPRLAAEHGGAESGQPPARAAGTAGAGDDPEPPPQAPPPDGADLLDPATEVPEQIEGQLAMPVAAEAGAGLPN